MKQYELLMRAKYHFTVCERLMEGYHSSEDRRFIIGFIRELAKGTFFLVESVLVFEQVRIQNKQKRFEHFTKNVGKKHFDAKDITVIGKIFAIEKNHKNSPISFSKKDTIILMNNGTYRFVTVKRLKEFHETTKKCAQNISNRFRVS